MWYKVKKDFGIRKAGQVIQLKDEGNYKSLVDAGHLEETEAPKSEVKPIDENSIYSVGTVVDFDKVDPNAVINEQIVEQPEPKKPGRKPKEQ